MAELKVEHLVVQTGAMWVDQMVAETAELLVALMAKCLVVHWVGGKVATLVHLPAFVAKTASGQ